MLTDEFELADELNKEGIEDYGLTRAGISTVVDFGTTARESISVLKTTLD